VTRPAPRWVDPTNPTWPYGDQLITHNQARKALGMAEIFSHPIYIDNQNVGVIKATRTGEDWVVTAFNVKEEHTEGAGISVNYIPKEKPKPSVPMPEEPGYYYYTVRGEVIMLKRNRAGFWYLCEGDDTEMLPFYWHRIAVESVLPILKKVE
jgi:hypothetical protein